MAANSMTTPPPLLASLVERLRFCEEHGLFIASLNDSVASYGEAATALEALAAENGALREALTALPEPHEYLDAARLKPIRPFIDALNNWRHRFRATLERTPQP